jgi:transcriptional repressor NrdR
MVVKRDGRREDFNPQKLREKLRIALTKRPIGEAQLDKLIDRVEGELLALGTREVDSTVVGELVLQELKQLDQVAYVRFASVYRQFADLEDLRRELDELNSK